MFPFVIAAGLGASSLVEYLLHRYYLHRSPREAHVLEHHRLFNGKTSYSNENAKRTDIASSNLYLAVNAALYFPFAYAFYQINRFFGVLFLLSAVCYTLWVEYAHLLFHCPAGRRIEDAPFFKRIKEHHRIHHVLYTFNYGIGSYWWDKIFKSMKISA